MKKTHSLHKGSLERRQKIIEAALDCFVTHGFIDTTMDDIRRRSKASNGSIYHHFNSKEELAAAVYLEGIGRYHENFLGELERYHSVRDGIHSIVFFHLGWVNHNPQWARYLFFMRHAPFMREMEMNIAEKNRYFLDRFYRWFMHFIEKGEVKRISQELYLALILGPCHEFAHMWVSGRAQTDLTSAGAVLADAAWQSLRPDGESH
jgi:AcrR family transcriptional regulator